MKSLYPASLKPGDVIIGVNSRRLTVKRVRKVASSAIHSRYEVTDVDENGVESTWSVFGSTPIAQVEVREES